MYNRLWIFYLDIEHIFCLCNYETLINIIATFCQIISNCLWRMNFGKLIYTLNLKITSNMYITYVIMYK